MQKPPDRPSDKTSTRDLIWAELVTKHLTTEAQLSAWSQTTLIDKIPEDEWVSMHEGTCGLCGSAGARFYARGWRCDKCRPEAVKRPAVS